MPSSSSHRHVAVPRRSRGWRVLLLLLPALFVPGAAWSQDTETALAIEFNFSNPGARSMGLGGAFAAIADDATAAFANPAGLVQLIEPEVSAEFRSWRYSTPFVESGRVFGEPTGIGLDTVSGLRVARSTEEVAGLSFLSFVYPKDRWALAFYRHQMANFEFASETQGIFRGVPEGGPQARERYAELRSVTNLEIVSHGVSAGLRLGERFSIGLGIARFEVELSAPSESYRPPNQIDPNPFLPEALQVVNVLTIDSGDWGINAGFLWQLADRWQLGGFYRQGAEKGEITIESRTGPGNPPADTLRFAIASPSAMPDVYGLGLAWCSPGGALTVGFEWDRVEYSTIVDSIDGTVFTLLPLIDDGDEIHLGAEVALLRSKPLVALRAGVWLDPDHRLRARDDADPFIRAVRQPGEDELHFAAGVGIVFQTMQVDLAVDLSDLRDTGSLSAIYRF
ncbi:MAG: hypothetical protein GY719_27670 [bacterium]|nr:hypothetical protein [bacterium]